MRDSVLQKYVGRQDAAGGSSECPSALAAEADDHGAFGFLRGERDRASMLELRKKDGSIRAIPYGWLEGCDFDPSDGIALHVGGRVIRIKGRNLNSGRPVGLFHAIARHRVPWVREADSQAQMVAPDTEPVVEAIEW
jgi:hypothetical protein